MAIFFRGLDSRETFLLTDAMRHSGDVIDLSGVRGVKVDKHSTGGVGDKTTLIVGPIASACGVPVAKMSGRGLGFTGGTLDKMEAIPGFRTDLPREEFLSQVNRIGLAVIGQTAKITPADKKLYALRDVTATIENIGLITASIMCKKLATGSDAIVLDVKCGKGAFMETEEEAILLGQSMVDIGTADGKKTIALITDMNQPLGRAVGNSIEVIEAIQTLQGKGPEDIAELSLTLAGYMIYAGEKATSPEHGRELALQALASGQALSKFKQFVEAQGGDPSIIDEPERLAGKTGKTELRAKESGIITGIQARNIGMASQHVGAGREKKEDPIDPTAGILLHRKVGDQVVKGDLLAVIYGASAEKRAKAVTEAETAYTFGTMTPEKKPIVIKVLT
jgi:pyrimidine-nucleoside phosphorylase